ncbi:MAG: protease family protein [Thermoanaerobacterium sp.]|nr:protease family protein [Thermoanaerobacterium sp.]
MDRFRIYIFRYPIGFSVIILIISTVFTEIRLEPYFTSFMDMQSAAYVTMTIEQGLFSILLVALIRGLGLMKCAGFTKPKEWKQLWLLWPILVLTILNGTPLFDGTLIIDTSKHGLIILYILLNLSVGFWEEILCRGTTLTVMLQKWGHTKKGIYLSVIASSLLFGLLHITNFIAGRSTFLTTAVQITYSTFFGVFFSACLLRNNSIWPAIITHAIFDTFGNLNEIALGGNFGEVHQTTFESAITTIAVTLLLFVYSLFIFRKVKPVNKGIEEKIYTLSLVKCRENWKLIQDEFLAEHLFADNGERRWTVEKKSHPVSEWSSSLKSLLYYD